MGAGPPYSPLPCSPRASGRRPRSRSPMGPEAPVSAAAPSLGRARDDGDQRSTGYYTTTSTVLNGTTTSTVVDGHHSLQRRAGHIDHDDRAGHHHHGPDVGTPMTTSTTATISSPVTETTVNRPDHHHGTDTTINPPTTTTDTETTVARRPPRRWPTRYTDAGHDHGADDDHGDDARHHDGHHDARVHHHLARRRRRSRYRRPTRSAAAPCGSGRCTPPTAATSPSIIAQAKRYGISAVYVKSSDGTSWWPQFSRSWSPSCTRPASRSAPGSTSTACARGRGQPRLPRRPRRRRLPGDRRRVPVPVALHRRADLHDAAAQAGRQELSGRAGRLPLRRLPPELPLLGVPGPGRRPVQPAADVLGRHRHDASRSSSPTPTSTTRSTGARSSRWASCGASLSASSIEQFNLLAKDYGATGVSWWDWQSAPLKYFSDITKLPPSWSPTRSTRPRRASSAATWATS